MLRIAFALPFFISACLDDETTSGYADPEAIYVLKEVNGTAFPAQATINFPEEGQIAGAAPCNTFSGNQSVPYPWFEARGIAATKRACAELDAEQLFFRTLGEMTLVEVSGPALILTNEAGGEMMFILQE